MSLKIAVIGAGSSYTPELIANLLEPGVRLDVDEVALVDPNGRKLELISGACRKLLTAAGRRISILPTNQAEAALEAADFVVLQIRVGGLEARVRDETLPMELGMVGNETTGPGGFVCALRTVPVALELARKVERLAPRAWLLNLTNPAGIVTEALLRHTGVRTVGFCNIPINTTHALADVLAANPAQVRLDSFGLNHLSWVRRAFVDGQEKLQDLIAATRDRQAPLYRRGLVDELMQPDFLRSLAMIGSWYVRYFYFPEQVLELDRRSGPTKGTRDMQAEERLAAIYSRSGYNSEARDILSGKGGAQYYVPVLGAMDAIVHDTGATVIADVMNQGALPDLPPEACVEVPARFYRDRTEPLPSGAMPLSVKGLVQTVKAYEQLTIEAALTGDRGKAISALMANPLCGSYGRASAFFERVLANERAFLPQFVQ